MNHDELNTMIAGLEGRLAPFGIKKNGEFWRDTWQLVRSIGDGFRGTRFPTAREHQEAWARFQGLVQKMKADNQDYADRKAKQFELSEDIKKDIFSVASVAWPRENGFAELALFVSGITPAIAIGKAMLSAIGLYSEKDWLTQMREKLQNCNAAMKRAWSIFEENKQRLNPKDRVECFNILKSTSDELQKAWTEWKDEANKKHQKISTQFEERERGFDHRRKLKLDIIDRAKSLSPSDKEDAAAMKELFSLWKEVGFAGKDHEDRLWGQFQSASESFWRARKAGRAEGLVRAIAKQTEFREKLIEWLGNDKENLLKFKLKRDSAWSDDYRSKMEEIVDDIAAKMEQKLEKINEVDSSIEDLTRKLRDLD